MPTHTGTIAALARGLAGSLALVVALAVMVTGGTWLADAFGATGFLARLIPAAIMTLVAVGLVALLLRRDRTKWGFVGVGSAASASHGFALGIAVVVASAALLLGGATAAGLVSWGPLDVATLLAFIATNAVIALLLEAIPEELTLRGYTLSALDERFGRAMTVVLTTAFFLLAPFLLQLGQSLLEFAMSEQWRPSFTPNGEDPIEYWVLLVVFGVTLAFARYATRDRSLGTSIGVHLAYLTVVRIAFGDAATTGWSLTLETPDAILVVPLLLVLAAVLFAVLGRRSATRRPRSRARRGPDPPSCAASTGPQQRSQRPRPAPR